MKKTPQLQVAELMVQVRRSVLYNLPVGNSSIPFDLVLLLFSNHARGGAPMSIKTLFGSLPYSDMGMRYHLNALLSEGWISIERGPRDNRLRLVRPTEKLIERFESVVHELAQVVDSISLNPWRRA